MDSVRWYDRYWGLLFIQCVCVAVFLSNFGKWADFIDYGREVYLAWQVSQGKLPVKDFSYLHGPLAPLLNGAVFYVFSDGILTYALAYFVMFCVSLALIFFWIRDLWGGLAAIIASLVFIFGFFYCSPGLNIWNFVTPYCSEASIGFLLVTITGYSLSKHLNSGSRKHLLIASLCFGLSFLLKAEFFVNTAAVLLFSFIAMISTRRNKSYISKVEGYTIFFAISCAIAPSILVALLYLSRGSPLELIAAVLGNGFNNLISGQIAGSSFSHHVSGFDTIAERSPSLVGALLALFAARLVEEKLVKKISLQKRILAYFFLGTGVFAASFFYFAFPNFLIHLLPFWMLIIFIRELIFVCRSERGADVALDVRRLLFYFGGIVLSLRIILNFQITGYGFFLAPLLVLAFVSFVVGGGLDGEGMSSRAMASDIVLVSALFFWIGLVNFKTSEVRLHRSDLLSELPVKDRFYTFPSLRAWVVSVGEMFKKHDVTEILIFPEGIMLNYLYRIPNPTRYELFVPTSVFHFKEEKMIENFETIGPKFIGVHSRDMSEYGAGQFGFGYGLKIKSWILSHYERVDVFSRDSLLDDKVGVTFSLYRRKN